MPQGKEFYAPWPLKLCECNSLSGFCPTYDKLNNVLNLPASHGGTHAFDMDYIMDITR